LTEKVIPTIHIIKNTQSKVGDKNKSDHIYNSAVISDSVKKFVN